MWWTVRIASFRHSLSATKETPVCWINTPVCRKKHTCLPDKHTCLPRFLNVTGIYWGKYRRIHHFRQAAPSTIVNIYLRYFVGLWGNMLATCSRNFIKKYIKLTEQQPSGHEGGESHKHGLWLFYDVVDSKNREFQTQLVCHERNTCLLNKHTCLPEKTHLSAG